MQTRAYIGERDDYYGFEGCCLTCHKKYPGCLCFQCKCKKCSWYEDKDFGGGRCIWHSDLEEPPEKQELLINA